jgi:hypothetical protein
MACADTATDKAKPATIINLIILFLPKPADSPDLSQRGWSGSRVKAAQASGAGRSKA